MSVQPINLHLCINFSSFAMPHLSPEEIVSAASQYKKEVELSRHECDSNPVILLLTLNRINADIPLLLSHLNHHKNNVIYPTTFQLLLTLHSDISELICLKKKQVNDFQKRYETTSVGELPEPESLAPQPQSTLEDYDTLRQRLLSDGTATLLDKTSASAEKSNQYHENFQEELYSDLTDLASVLKSSALSLSSKILDDSKLVDSTSEKMHKNLTLMLTVGKNLNGYLSEKTGGKISLWFLIKTMVGVFTLAIVMLVLIKVLPKM